MDTKKLKRSPREAEYGKAEIVHVNDALLEASMLRVLAAVEAAEQIAATPQQDSIYRKRIPALFGDSSSEEWVYVFACAVLHVRDDEDREQRMLRCVSVDNEFNREDECLILLHDDWLQCLVQVGDHIHIIGPPPHIDENGGRLFIVDRCSRYLLIVQPDIMLTGTRIGDATFCERRAVLAERIADTSTLSSALLLGTLAHTLFQACLNVRDFSSNFIGMQIEIIIANNRASILSIGESEVTVKEYLQTLSTPIAEWGAVFVMSILPNKDNEVEFRNTKFRSYVDDVLEIEESIWSPVFGLKGKLDATVQLSRKSITSSNGLVDTVIAPLELKTGRRTSGNVSLSHRAQALIYMLLASVRYNRSIPMGLLLYLQSEDKTNAIDCNFNELRALLIKRNVLAAHLAANDSGQIPPMLMHRQHACERCYLNDSCFLYHKAYENGTATSSTLGEFFETRTRHISSKHLQYFMRWDRMIEQESREARQLRTEMWNLSAIEREKLGRCIANAIVKESKVNASGAIYVFIRASWAVGPSFIDLEIAERDMVVVSRQGLLDGVQLGTVSRISCDSIEVNLFHQLSVHLLEETFIEDGRKVIKPALWRIDLDQYTSGYTRMRSNVVNLFLHGGDEKSRQRVVDLVPPSFDIAREMRLPDLLNDKLAQEFKALNCDQRSAVCRAFSAKDYALILGMPGTGKTYTIVFLIRVLVSLGMTVLITSHTNSAVDTILLKLLNYVDQVPFLRFGKRSQIHPSLLEHSLDNHECKRFESCASLKTYIDSKRVMASTCLGVFHPLLADRKFDLVIGDEASQMTQPLILGPMRYGDRFVLVGDHYQLPPLVKDANARESGMDVSMFMRLSSAHPQAISHLNYQYRMNRDILLLCNTLVYDHALRCGNAMVADQKLCLQEYYDALPDIDQSYNDNWLCDVLQSYRSVTFLDTDRIPIAMEQRVGHGVRNDVEAVLAAIIVRTLIKCRVEHSQIGVISPYRLQRQILRRLLHDQQCQHVDVETVDRYQGRDKDCIIISFVRSTSCKELRGIGELLQDWRRINVALTRAKKKIIMIGSRSTIQRSSILNHLLELLSNHNWIYSLPIHAVSMYPVYNEMYVRLQRGDLFTSPCHQHERMPKRIRVLRSHNNDNTGKCGVMRQEIESCDSMYN